MDRTPSDAEWAGRRVVVMGLGRFGGGAGAARWLAEQGADVLVTDLADAGALDEPLASIRDLVDAGRVTLRLGGHDEADFAGADTVVVSPAVPRPWENRFILAAAERGARMTTEIRLLVERLPDRGRVVGVTGTAGKSTTAAMIAHILRRLAPGRTWLGGNIGGSLLPRAHEIEPEDWVVLELSSAMLYWLGDWFVGRRDEPGWSPHVAVVTNVAPNHLDWHGEFAHYERCKRTILAHQRPGDRAIDGRAGAPECETALAGAHNRRNAGLAVAATRAMRGTDDDADAMRDATASFTGLPHRLQLVAEVERDGGVIRAVNDSKSTTPEATALAVQAFAEVTDSGATGAPPNAWVEGGTGVSPVVAVEGGAGVSPVVASIPVHLIAGGFDKGVDLTPMVGPAARCRGVFTIGATGPALARLVQHAGGRAEACGGLDQAVAQAVSRARPGETVLLSPGCASWDQFTNYEERGRRFTALVRAGLGLSPAPEGLFEMPPALGP
ncbi:MAG: hypothetical protein D6693_00260 [Planctomycetota bacterium]|nr:MAG: hypothetical protein D6693_00260 [Planctomycetota bacterium]